MLRNLGTGVAVVGVVSVWLALLAPVAGLAGTMVGEIRVYSPEEVAGFVVRDGDQAFLEFPGARRWAVASDGKAYRPMPVDEVLEALRAINYPTEFLEAAILILSWPRCDLPQSSAEGTVVFLSPGRIEYPTEHVHYTVAHEMGHVLHHTLMPDSREDLWIEYACLRGVDPAAAGSATGHASRIHEMFAEDFRALFGGILSQCGSGVENHDLVPPEQVVGLREFFLSLPERREDTVRIHAEPNPFSGRLAIRIFGLAESTHIDEARIYDVEGRLVAAVAGSGLSSCEIVWDGSTTDGLAAVPGAYFVAVAGPSKTQVVKVLKIPR